MSHPVVKLRCNYIVLSCKSFDYCKTGNASNVNEFNEWNGIVNISTTSTIISRQQKTLNNTPVNSNSFTVSMLVRMCYTEVLVSV